MWESLATDVCQCPPRNKRPELFLDKENIPQTLSPAKSEDLSLYGSSSPLPPVCTGTSPNHCSHNIIPRRPLEDHDPNSRDSGYGTTFNGEVNKYPSQGSRGLSFESNSVGSFEDAFLEDFSDIEPLEDSNLPKDFNKLISAPLVVPSRSVEPLAVPNATSPNDLVIRPLFRRALSFQHERTTPNSSKVRSCLFQTGDARSFKRPEPPQEIESPTNTKKMRMLELGEVPCTITRPVLQRAMSATEESIMSAVQRSSIEPDLIGDFSKNFCLPLTQGRHQDLKSITPTTLARLIQGDFNGNVSSYKVIDCRYPYEYEGGHIEGAINIYTKEQCLDLLKHTELSQEDSKKRDNILVFHCEFSSERGPNLYRFLRKQDRQLNEDAYPSLNYPEIYLLEGGYKNFFEQYANLCVPVAYKEMLHPEHESELRFFRQKSKSCNLDSRQRQYHRSSLKRLGL